MKRRKTVLALLLVLVAVLFGASILQTRALEKELQTIADAQAAELRKQFENEGAMGPAQVGSRVVASKTLLLFGTATGKISVFVRHPAEGGNGEFIEAFEFFYERSADGWSQTESGRCASERCTLEGKKVLDALNREK